ncbi:hypothetical protein G647_00245 [Cladophialophora carrionii CBS 160.54]|uniref:Transcription factor domain-containing protein n=1 Tax=Cladophialophora carrionii CBS 160.54 TaxID=1279043 RepID=V9DMA7_9EURO|nr:uncharacterized protein G647_00245 [Cladophialophora carrionii CBS 160.54]ETI27796.1 hypothetical protein G647_00245 [Cladophialophora carrionii CBS 160.54]
MLPQAQARALQSPSRTEAHSSPANTSHPKHSTSPGLPSLYSSSPLDVLGSVATQPSSAEAWPQQQLTSRDTSLGGSWVNNVAEDVLVEYIEFFRAKILYCVPVIDDADLENPLYVIRRRRPLAYCTSFVASQFIPGSANVRQQLLSHVSDFVESTNGPLTEDENVLWTQLQALAVLYAYRPAADVFELPGATPTPGPLNHWVLKHSIEAFALRARLHRSIDGLRSLLLRSSNSPQVSESPAFHKYVYWLWLATMSHHFSVMTRTPPTIREDSSISSAVDLLRDVPRPSRVTRILSEIDLYILWQHAGRSVPGLAEWWCTPSDTMSVEDVQAVLEDMEGALEVWSQRWGLRGEPKTTVANVDMARNGAVSFHFLSTRFCISTFETRYLLEKTRSVLDEDATSQPGLVQVARESVLKSVKAAHACSRCLVDLPPLRREFARYMAEFGYAYMAFCCLYIIQAYELFGSALPALESYLASVEEVATFLTELAVASNTTPRLYGDLTMRQLRRATGRMEGARVDRQPWTGQDVENLDGQQVVPASLRASPVGGEHLLSTSAPSGDPGVLSHLNPPRGTSPLLFSIFDPSWGPLLR